MGLFSRRKPSSSTEGAGGAPTGPGAGVPDEVVAPDASGPDRDGRGGAADAPSLSDAVRGTGRLVEHRSLQAALDVWAGRKDVATFHDVVRELAAGELLLDIGDSTIADPSRGLQQGDVLAVARQTDSAGKAVLLAFTSNDRLATFRQTADTRSLAQPATAVVQQVLADHDGLALDAGSPGQFIVYRDELVRGLGEDPTAVEPLKHALAERTLPWSELLVLLHGAAPLWRAEMPDADPVVPTASDPEGRTWSVVHASPAEVLAWAPAAEPRRVTLAEVATVALAEGHAGVVVDPRGPSVTVLADELRALLGR